MQLVDILTSSKDGPLGPVYEGAELKRRALRGSVFTLGSQFLRMLIQVSSQIVLARLLMPSDFGLIAMASPVIGFVQILTDIGLGQAIIQRQNMSQSTMSTLFWVNFAISIALALVVIVIAPVAAWIYQDPRILPLITALSGSIVIGTLGIHPAALIARNMRFGVQSRNDIISALVGVGVIIACALHGFGYWSLVTGVYTTSIIGTGLAWAACRWRPTRPAFDRAAWHDLRFGSQLTGANLANFVTSSADNVITGLMAGSTALGLYDRSYRLVVQPVTQILAPVSRVAVPLLSRLLEKPVEYRSIYFDMVRAFLYSTVPLMLVCTVEAHGIIILLFGVRWSAASPIFSWISVGGLTSAIYTSSFWLFISQGRSTDMLKAMVVSSIINVSSFVIGGYFGGILGLAATASVAFVFLSTPFVLYKVTRAGPIDGRTLLGCLLPYVVAGSVTFVALRMFLGHPSASEIVSLFIAFAVSYGIFGLVVMLFPAERGRIPIIFGGLSRMLRARAVV